MSGIAKRVADRLRAGALVVVVVEPDEALATASIRAVAAEAGGEPVRVMSGVDDQASSALAGHPRAQGVLVLQDYLAIEGENPIACRMVREVALQQRDDGSAYSRLVLVEQPSTQIPPSLAGDVEVIRCPLPSVEELGDELLGFLVQQEEGRNVPPVVSQLLGDDAARYQLAQACAGLPRHEAQRLYARCLVETRGLDPTWVRAEKAARVAQRLGGALTFERADAPPVGGLGALRRWLGQRAKAFGNPEAKAFGLREPKGLLLLGTPGSGKSLTAKTVAKEWGLPLLRLDAGKLFGSLVGQSESNTRLAIEAAEASAPCVVWIDEIEKGFGGVGGASTDGGTSQRVFGTFLSWLQDKDKPVFVVATANRVNALPPELLRKGRFDEIFFVGLPTEGERAEIFRIHLERRGRSWPEDWLATLARAAENFSGAEVEQAVEEGLAVAFDEGNELSLDHVVDAIRATNPLYKTMGDEVKALESWARTRARPASDDVSSPSRDWPRSGSPRRGPSVDL